MKKLLIVMVMASMCVLLVAGIATAAPSTNTNGYSPLEYNIISGGTNLDVGWPSATMVNPTETPTNGPTGTAQWSYYSANIDRGYDFVGYTTSTHPQGTWNSPYTGGIDGYNYNDPQDYIMGSRSTLPGGTASLDASGGPHGGYTTSTHKCRECHAVHRASGKFKLTRSDTRMGACDWCHGTGAGSGFNIQMDNDDNMSREYDVGHSLGFGLSSGKWKAPDDTNPAYTPKFYMGGFSCFDCHSPHANPLRILGGATAATQAALISAHGASFDPDGAGPLGVLPYTGQTFIANPGHDIRDAASLPATEGPLYAGGSWLLLENPDANEGVNDWVAGTSPSGGPINKFMINWDDPFGPNQNGVGVRGYKDFVRGTTVMVSSLIGISDFCTDCHDGNAGLSTTSASMFSEDRALRNQTSAYDIGYSHDANPSH